MTQADLLLKKRNSAISLLPPTVIKIYYKFALTDRHITALKINVPLSDTYRNLN